MKATIRALTAIASVLPQVHTAPGVKFSIAKYSRISLLRTLLGLSSAVRKFEVSVVLKINPWWTPMDSVQ